MGFLVLKYNQINLIERCFELWWISMDHKLAVTGPAKQNKSKRLSRRFFVGFKLFSALRLASMRNALASDAVAALLGECAGIFLLHSKQFSRRG